MIILGTLAHWGSTTVHKLWVAYYLLRYWASSQTQDSANQLIWRAIVHDLSKYRWDETRGFAKTIFRLRGTTYGTDEYRALLREIKPSLDLHYQRNSHHPEYWPNGISDMSDHDRIEMIADWAAAIRRHADGDLATSIAVNKERFGYNSCDALLFETVARRMKAL